MPLPVILLPVGVDDAALDACLAALEKHTPAGTPVWLADDGQSGPRGKVVIEHWLASTRLQAEYTRRPRPIGEAAHLDEMLKACGDADVAVLAPDGLPTAGWLQQLSDCLARDASIATATPWSNAGEAVSWPRAGELNPLPADPARLAQALAAMPLLQPELPSAVTHAVLIRGSARRRAGGLDIHSYGSWYAALVDLSLRMSGLGWRNVLCDNAFVGRQSEGRPAEGDMEVLANRWPVWTARLAAFLMNDPLHAHRQQLQQLCEQAIMPQAQPDLFDALWFPSRRGAGVSDSIAVVVVSYQSASTLDECLQRLRAATDVAEIRVVDNESRDGSLAIAQRHALADSRVRFIANPDNPGFATACNQGADECHSPWLAFVNPDLMVEPQTLAQLRDLGRPLGDCLLGVEQVDEDGVADPAVRRRDPDFAAMLRNPGAGSRLAVQVDNSAALQQVQALSGALLLMPRGLFDRLQGWDAGYRLHAEDLDLCRRARQAGAVVAIANDLKVLHVRGVSSRSRPFFVEWHKHRGLWRYFRKFEASQRSLPVRAGVWCAIWAHAALQVPRLLLR